MALDFRGKVVIVTGAARGIGKEYCNYFADQGAKVVVNNRCKKDSENYLLVNEIVRNINLRGGIAIANYDDILDGDHIIKQAIDNFGRIDILINNAGIIKDNVFAKMSKEEYEDVVNVHLNGTYKCCKAAWPYMIKQRYGKIINTISGSGLYGQVGQANYATAKSAIIGFSFSLAKEGEEFNIRTNILSPVAASRMTETILPQDMLEGINPNNVAPLVAYLCSDDCQENGAIYECSGGFISRVRLDKEPIDFLKWSKL
ncbi:unnamed protein product [Paramecium primaurelia]|uniref:Uncharacterized protein n=1 Tax=Paramecium primaurelia TaxID=5886 RepID=A0A8S1PUB7_PARPR|nr:unnamed protein product [Paramecium primaurelia]